MKVKHLRYLKIKNLTRLQYDDYSISASCFIVTNFSPLDFALISLEIHIINTTPIVCYFEILGLFD